MRQARHASTTAQESRALLTKRRLKVTKARLVVLDVLRSARRPMSVHELLKAARGRAGGTVTVYRMVNSFVARGILRAVNLRHDHLDYELIGPTDHHHIVCVKCGLIEDFTGCGAGRMAAAVLKKSRSFKLVREHAIELFGTCRSCAGAEPSSKK